MLNFNNTETGYSLYIIHLPSTFSNCSQLLNSMLVNSICDNAET
jgi:hypothetical protein